MPQPKRLLNAFTARDVQSVTGLSLPMIDYLRRSDFLVPAYAQAPGRRGKVRYYSYRDLVVARLIQRLRQNGVELSAIKTAITILKDDALWDGLSDNLPTTLRWLRTDGRNVFLDRQDGVLEHMRADHQGAFAFLVNIGELAAEVRECVPEGIKRDNFSMKNYALMAEPSVRRKRGGA
jgi:DNA-binding transcriptional MerR regulator